jgi:transcriptional regulator with XRE-family HTH domain
VTTNDAKKSEHDGTPVLSSPSSSLADRLSHLLEAGNPAGRSYTLAEVAAGIEQQGVSISTGYIGMLKKGDRTNPTKEHIQALARFFRVPVSYFFDDDIAGAVDDELAFLARLRDSSVREIALRASDLTPESREDVLEMVRAAERIELRSNPDRSEPTGD